MAGGPCARYALLNGQPLPLEVEGCASRFKDEPD
jgi:hypothetical protein